MDSTKTTHAYTVTLSTALSIESLPTEKRMEHEVLSWVEGSDYDCIEFEAVYQHNSECPCGEGKDEIVHKSEVLI